MLNTKSFKKDKNIGLKNIIYLYYNYRGNYYV